MTMKISRYIPIGVIALALAGCALVQTTVNKVTTGNSYGIPTPGYGQWVDFGKTEPAINGNSFAFPNSNGTAGYFYTKINAGVGQTVTLNYSIRGSNPVWGVTDPSDVAPASITLFLWRSGDDLSCNGALASYRMWFPLRAQLKIGDNQIISAKLDPTKWTNCYAKSDPAGFSAALTNALGLGFTFGGQNFYGHGVDLQSGSATFTINSFTVQ
jgi:hypothetical protein